MKKRLLVLLVLVGLAACNSLPTKTAQTPLLLADHVLADKIWDVRAQQFIGQQQLLERLVDSEFLLLGETHDNPLHHRYQSWVIDGLHAHRRSAIVAFEMISRQQGNLIADQGYDSLASLLAVLKQAPSNWQYDPHYIPLFESAIKAGFGIRAASLDRERIMAIGKQGEQEIPAPIKTALDYNALTAGQEAALRKEIVDSHCGMEHEGMVAAMMLTQRVKDAVMMDSLLNAGEIDTRVLVAGSGHARKDWGVPKYLAQARPTAQTVAMAWMEVAPEAIEVADYARRWGDGALPFDYVWFTPRVDRPDPCEQFRQHMKNRPSTETHSETKSDAGA